MPERFVVHEGDAGSGPRTHVLVIGVGRYPHLIGGDGPLTPSADGMRQLTSPPVSARAVARWFTRLRHPEKPLGTIALLLSERSPAPFRATEAGPEIDVEEATIDNVVAALRGWKERGMSDPADRLIFYFCGHGVAQGTAMSLLLADYGADPDNAFDGALDLPNLLSGLESCVAREQVFFIDACRQSTDTLINANVNGYAGRVPFQPVLRRLGAPIRQYPVYYSTLAGFSSQGDADSESIFTAALLRSLDGAGSDNPRGDWRVDTTSLLKAIGYFVDRALQSGLTQVQVPGGTGLTTFDLHYLVDPPIVPVTISCNPLHATDVATLSWAPTPGAVVVPLPGPSRRAPEPGPWTVDLPFGEFGVTAEFANGSFHDAHETVSVRPAFRIVELQV